MSVDRDIKFNIHFGGSMVMKDKTYQYDGGMIEVKNVVWKTFEINWKKFEDLVLEDKVSAPVAIIWYKLPCEGMEKVQYTFYGADIGLYSLFTSGEREEFDIYIEHQCPEMHIEGETVSVSALHGNENEDDDTNDAYDGEDEKDGSDGEGDEEEEEKEQEEEQEEQEEEEEIPKDDMDVDVSDNEIVYEIRKKKGKEKAVEVDDGEDVVPEIGDASTDARFTSLFDEAENAEVAEAPREEEVTESKTEMVIRDGTIREEEIGDVSNDSESDYNHEVEPYPDTPVSTDEEWERLKKLKNTSDSFYEDYKKV